MRAKSEQPIHFDAVVAGMLACPACHGDLCFETGMLVCVACGRRYPVKDGIPVLIAERAEKSQRS